MTDSNILLAKETAKPILKKIKMEEKMYTGKKPAVFNDMKVKLENNDSVLFFVLLYGIFCKKNHEL